MGFNHAAAFAPPVSVMGRPYYPPFAGPIVGFSPEKHAKATLQPKDFPPIEVVSVPINIGKSATALLDLRGRWLTRFLEMVKDLCPEMGIPWAVEWLDRTKTFPTTAKALAESFNNGDLDMTAAVCITQWNEKP